MLAKHRTLFTFALVAIIIIVSTAVIFWARGFKLDYKNGTISRTGLIVASSTPTGAQVYLDDRLTAATDTNISFLEPKTYKVRIEKDGYTKWEKDIEIKADLATEIKALLFPIAPEIKPLSTTGAASPTLSPDGTKIAYGVSGQRGGIYILPMSDRPFPFRQEARLLTLPQSSFDFTNAKFIWSPDSKQIIARVMSKDGEVIANLMFDADRAEQDARDVTGALNATLIGWQDQLDLESSTKVLIVPDSVKSATTEATLNQLPTTSNQLPATNLLPSPSPSVNRQPLTVNELNYFPSGLIFSPDEEKILYFTKENRYKVFDLKTKKEYTLPNLPDLLQISWFPDSGHIVVAQKNLISIVEFDGFNKMSIFQGNFENGFVFAHPSGNRIIILTRLTQQEALPPNLYSINLK